MVREDMHPIRFWRRGALWFMVVLQLLWVVVYSVLMVVVTKYIRWQKTHREKEKIKLFIMLISLPYNYFVSRRSKYYCYLTKETVRNISANLNMCCRNLTIEKGLPSTFTKVVLGSIICNPFWYFEILHSIKAFVFWRNLKDYFYIFRWTVTYNW
jgi:hypothetical protein